jgi:multiple antibiotic resistance protein
MVEISALSQYALVAFSSVFIIVDPFATAPLFVTMTEGDTPAQRDLMARRASIAAWLALTTFALGGDALLRLFSITLGAVRIAGGVILFGIGLNMLRLRESREIQTPEEVQEGVEKEDIALIPLAIPMLSGPGAISTVLVLTQQATSFGHYAILLAVIALTCSLSYVVLKHATRVTHVLGETGLRILSRLMGLLLAVIAVQFIMNGIAEALTHLVQTWRLSG